VNRPNHSPARPRPPVEDADRQPLIRQDGSWRVAAQISTVGLFILASTACVYLARPILLPVVSAMVIGAMLAPLSRRAAAYRIPPSLFATIVLLVIVALLQAITFLVSGPIAEWIRKGPEYVALIGAKFEALEQSVPALRIVGDAIAKGTAGVAAGVSVASILEPVVSFVTPAIGELLIFFATLFFFLVSRNELRRDLVLLFEEQEARLRALRILNDIEHALTRYLGTVTLINIVLGVVTGLGAYLLGLPNPVLFGVLAYVTNYMPYVGPAFMLVVLFVTGAISFPGFAEALVAPALFLAVATVEGHFITPNIVGQRFTLNPFAVFLSLAFWTWAWGPVGTFLSVPFLMIAIVVLNHLVIKQEPELPE
jgi:predicted PurR-regulated permease PerM